MAGASEGVLEPEVRVPDLLESLIDVQAK